MRVYKLKYTGLFYLILLHLIILYPACGPGRSVSEPATPQPGWVRSRPITPGYYTGIGWAQKTSNVHQYQQAAKQNALSDLASEISVNISSNSVLHAFESNLGFREDFTSTIQARTEEELEGFEIIDTWEDQHNYWIYYSLSAAKHQELKEKRRSDAARLSAAQFENAITNREKGNLRSSLVQLINSMESIKNYFDEPLPVEFRGRDIYLGNSIFNELSSTISQIEITPVQSQIEVKTGQKVPISLLKFFVHNQSGEAVSNFPLLANYSERPIRNNRARTGRDGAASFDIEVVRSSRTHETFTVSVDMETILAEATTDPMIRRLVTRFSVPRGIIRINILMPVITLITEEYNIDEELSSGTLRDSFRKNAITAGYIIDNDPSNADYLVRITARTIAGSKVGTYKNAVLTGNISVEMPDGNMIYHRELEGFRGSHFDFTRAGEEAFRQAARRIESSFFREIDEALKRSSSR